MSGANCVSKASAVGTLSGTLSSFAQLSRTIRPLSPVDGPALNERPEPWTRHVSAPAWRAASRQPSEQLPGFAGRVSTLEALVRTEVFPRLLQARAGARLADFLRADDVGAALSLVRSATGDAAGLSTVRAALFTAAARELGDGWLCDHDTEVGVTLGLFTLHAVLRHLDQQAPPGCGCTGTALVAPQSGEPHSLDAVMSAQTLRATGWHVQCEFPADDAELATLLAERWFDRLDLSLSPAHGRLDRLDDLAATIAMARLASPNTDLTISVAGRAFVENAELASQVGADTEATRR